MRRHKSTVAGGAARHQCLVAVIIAESMLNTVWGEQLQLESRYLLANDLGRAEGAFHTE